ncbi:hypothetical protein ACHAWO_000405 [Cyclotella atomus]|uniref:Uncharacterized protein n=1 Tax=Cyclotella atomus TaxID=382360 RepID=A0ABD3QCY8_9STRA
MAPSAEKELLRERRLSEGLCPECGTRLYKVVKARRQTMKTLFKKDTSDGNDTNVKMIPLTLPGVVERGQCMKCPSVGARDTMGVASTEMMSPPAAKAVPVTIMSPAMAYAQDRGSDEDLLGLIEREHANDSSPGGSDKQNFNRSDTGNSVYSTDTEYEDVPLLDLRSMDLKEPSGRGGVAYAHSDSAGLDDDDLFAPIPDRSLDGHFFTTAAATPSDMDQKMPSKPEPVDCPDGMSADVFYQLPPEVQKEVSRQGSAASNSGNIDPDTLASLPEHLRQEVLDQVRGNSKEVSFSLTENTSSSNRSTKMDRKSLSKSTKDFLSGYEIGEDDFDELDDDVKNDLLAEKAKLKGKGDGRKEKLRSSLTKSTLNFLSAFDINEEDFDDLDDDVKNDLLAQKRSGRSSILGPCSTSEIETEYDQELLASLPEDLRTELLEEERRKRERTEENERRGRRSVGAHCVNVPAGYDPDTFEALPLDMQMELMDAASGGVVYSAEGYGSESIAMAPIVNAHAPGQDVATYEGDYNAVGKRHGEGTLTWANGDVYVGWFKNGYMEGRGTITFHDGTEYSGQWHKNKFHGVGTRRFKNGNVYNGNYVEGRRQGQGKCHFANGDLYSGNWKNDTIQGFGRYYYNNGHCFEGMFRNGQRNGRGKYQLTDGRVEIYRYVNDSRVGDGVRWSADRKKAWKMNGGKVVKRISMDDATAIANRCGPVLEDS